MELKEVEKFCCVVSVLESSSEKPPMSFSGVVVHPPTGTVLCTGVPFTRFITETDPLSADRIFLSPRSFSEKLQIRVSFSDAREPGEAFLSPGTRKSHNREVSAELQMLVNCVEFKETFQEIFQEADHWRFHTDEEDKELIQDALFLSWFAVLKASVMADGIISESVPWESSSLLQKGQPVIACGSPFGSLCLDLFSSTLSRGIISNLAGEDNAVILTDARCLPGTEGGGVFALKGIDNVRLVGLIVSPFGWKANEWIGLSLVCSIHSIFRNISRCMRFRDLFQEDCLHPVESSLPMSITASQTSDVSKYPTVCLVESGQVWGSGVLVTPQLVVTCRHVVNGKSMVTLKFHHKDR